MQASSILIVDDAPESLVLLTRVLRSGGYENVDALSSVSEALRQLGVDGRPAQRNPDLILLDLLMPEMDGITACRRIKEDERLRDIPVLMVTARTEEAELEAAFAAGASDYIMKPIRARVLLGRVQNALRLKHEIDARKARERELLEVQRRLEEANERLRKLATMDGLTGIANRRHFDECLKREWRRTRREHEPLSVIFLDIDHFKLYNDTYGHQAGDECLKAIAGLLGAAAQRAGDLAARYGGEEFALVLLGADEEGARSVARAVHEAVAALKIEHASSPVAPVVTVSVGVATLRPTKGMDEEELVAAADRRLYQAKQAGRNRIQDGGC